MKSSKPPKANSFIETLKKLRHSKPVPVFCPVCKSPKIALKPNYGILPQVYACNECGYEGTLVLELVEEDEPNDTCF